MEKVYLQNRSTKNSGKIQLRFRLRDGRHAELYHKSDIIADLKDLEKFNSDGSLKKGMRYYNASLLGQIQNEINLMINVYRKLKNSGYDITKENYERMIFKELNPEDEIHDKDNTLINRLNDYVDNCYQNGLWCANRYAKYRYLATEMERYLTINSKTRISASEFTNEDIMKFRSFVTDEYIFVNQYPDLYANEKSRAIPKEKRNNNTVSTKMRQLKAFFTALEDTEEIIKSPFRKLDRISRKMVVKEKYNDPIYLKIEELQKIINADVPDTLQETKDAFLLDCALGCRVGDFQRLNMQNVAVSNEGIPYIHYLPAKTKEEQNDYTEIKTPIIRYALDLIKKYEFNFSILNYVSGKSGYNYKIKKLLEFCDIDRKVTIYDENIKDNVYVPVYTQGMSKICRKTHVDIMTKAQVNRYAAGLHKIGSDAVNHYTKLELSDHFILMCYAFQQPMYKVDNKLNVI